MWISYNDGLEVAHKIMFFWGVKLLKEAGIPVHEDPLADSGWGDVNGVCFHLRKLCGDVEVGEDCETDDGWYSAYPVTVRWSLLEELPCPQRRYVAARLLDGLVDLAETVEHEILDTSIIERPGLVLDEKGEPLGFTFRYVINQPPYYIPIIKMVIRAYQLARDPEVSACSA